MGYILYNLLAGIIYIGYFITAIFKRDLRDENSIMRKRLGISDKELKERLNKDKIIWVHASSVGEVNSIIKTVEILKDRYKNHKILVSTMTESGQKFAKEKTEGDYFIILPLDFYFVMKKLVKVVKAEILIIAETEIWPNFILLNKKMGTPLFLISGSVSDKSKKIYKRYLHSLIKKVLESFAYLGMQSQKDFDNVSELISNSDKMEVTGDTKFDNFIPLEEEEIRKLKKEYGILEEDRVFLAGSTHEGEEELMAKLYINLEKKVKNFKLIVAPRHLNRVESVIESYTKLNLKTVRRSEIKEIKEIKDESIIILDTIGELSNLYAICDVAFVGGSLVDIGGHSIMEPIAQGKVTVLGKYIYGLRDNIKIAKDAEVAIVVENIDEMITIVKDLLLDKEKLLILAEKAKEIVKNNRGASRKNIEKMESVY